MSRDDLVERIVKTYTKQSLEPRLGAGNITRQLQGELNHTVRRALSRADTSPDEGPYKNIRIGKNQIEILDEENKPACSVPIYSIDGWIMLHLLENPGTAFSIDEIRRELEMDSRDAIRQNLVNATYNLERSPGYAVIERDKRERLGVEKV